MEKYGSQEFHRNRAIEKLVAAGIVLILSFSYKGCKSQELHELLKEKTEKIDGDPSDTGVLMQRGDEQLFIDYQDQDTVKVYNYIGLSPKHRLRYTIKSNEKYGQGEIDGKQIDSQIAIYSINKILHEITKPTDPISSVY